MRTIMKATTYGAIGVATALLITACVLLEDRIANVTTPDFAAVAIDAGCAGGQEFLETAIAGVNPSAAKVIAEGVKAACDLRAERTPISATVYDNPISGFCAETKPLSTEEATPQTRAAFNTSRAQICEPSL